VEKRLNCCLSRISVLTATHNDASHVTMFDSIICRVYIADHSESSLRQYHQMRKRLRRKGLITFPIIRAKMISLQFSSGLISTFSVFNPCDSMSILFHLFKRETDIYIYSIYIYVHVPVLYVSLYIQSHSVENTSKQERTRTIK
jgi:hypothetical protein